MNVNEFITIFSNPTITAIVGAIAGGLASFFPLWAIQHNKDIKFKNNVKQYVKIELSEQFKFLKKCISEGTDDNENVSFLDGIQMIKTIKQNMPNRKLKLINYHSLTAETKSHVFHGETLIQLEKTYREMSDLTYRVADPENNTPLITLFTKTDLINVIKLITESIDKLK